MRNLNAIAAALSLTARRVGQLVDLGVVIVGPDGRADVSLSCERYEIFRRRDPYSIAALIDDAERAGLAAAEAAERLGDHATLAEAGKAATLALEFDQIGKLLEAMRPEHQRPLLRYVRESVVAEIAARALEVAERHGGAQQ